MIDNNQAEGYIIQECRGRSPLPGFGVSPKNSFSFFAAVGGMKKQLITNQHFMLNSA